MTVPGRRSWRVAAALAALVASGGPLAAQEGAGAGPYVTVGSRLDELVVWAQEAGALARLDPLTRPWRLDIVRAAVAREDTSVLTPGARTALRWVADEIGARDSSIVVAEMAVQAFANGRRESFRWSDSGAVVPAVAVRVELARGPIVAVINPALDNRLKHDPEWGGYTARTFAGRLQEAYVAAMGRYGELHVGRTARNWGPAPFQGVMLSPSAYASDEIAATVRLGRFALTSIAQRLDDADTTATVVHQRWLAAHRLSVDVGRGGWVALSETAVYGGYGQGFDPVMHAPLGLALLAQYNEGRQMNSMVGADALVPLGRGLRLGLALMLDDIQVHDEVLTDDRPSSYAATATLSWAAAAPLHAVVGYTRVSALAYRNSFEPYSVYTNRNVGLARNFADYDQLLLRVEARPRATLRTALDLTVIRQGAGDFRQPFPPDSVLAQPGQGFLTEPVHTLPGARASLEWWGRGALRVQGQLGVVKDLGGAWQPIASVALGVRADLLHGRLGGPVGAVAFP